MTDTDLTITDYNGSPLNRHLAKAEAHLKAAQTVLDGTTDLDGDTPYDALAHAKRIRRRARAVERNLTDAAIAEMHHSGQAYHVGKGYTAVLRPGEERRSWRSTDIIHDLIAETVESASAKYPYVPRKALRALIGEAMWTIHKVGRIEWRSTDLRDHGLDPDAYSEHVTTTPSLDMRGDTTHATALPTHRRLP